MNGADHFWRLDVEEYGILRTDAGQAHNSHGVPALKMRLASSWKRHIGFLFVILTLGLAVATAQTPAVVVSSTQTLVPALAGNTHHIAVNSLGDVFYKDDGTYSVYELVPGNSTPILLLTGTNSPSYMASSLGGIAVDGSNNVYIVNTYNNGSQGILVIPYLNGSYQTGQLVANVTATCTTPLTADCVMYGQGGGSVTGYFLQASDLTFDGQGNMYLVDHYDNVSGGAYNRIIEIPASQIEVHYPSGLLIADHLPTTYGGEVSADAAGDVYYADGSNVYAFAAGTTVTAGSPTPTSTIGTGLKNPGGVAVDAFGDLIITDSGNNRLVEIPWVNGALDTTDQYLLSYTYSANSVAIDTLGHIYYSGYANSATTIGEETLWNANLGTLAVGASSSELSLNFAFNSSATPAAISVLPSGGAFAIASGGTCAANTAQSQGSSCTVNVTVTPNVAGTESGAILLSDSTGTPIATAYLYGTGEGAAQSVDPGTVTGIGSGWNAPAGITVDAAHNVYIADTGANAVYEYSPGGTLLATIGSGLSAPTGVAVDGAGNVYIADSGNQQIVEVPVVNGALSNAAQTTVLTGIAGPSGLSVDAGGNLFVADSGNNRVLRLPNMSGAPNAAHEVEVGSPTATGANFTAPEAVTTDEAGDTFIAGQNSAVEVQAVSGAQTTVISSLSNPGGIAIDASGSLYIADTGNSRVIRIPNENGTLNAAAVINVGAGIDNPSSVAIDSSGNLYVTDSSDQLVDQIDRTQGALLFPSLNLNTSSGSETATVGNTGNQTLTFGTPLYTATGDTSVFAVSVPSPGGCAGGGSLAPGYDCALSAVFTPTANGLDQDTLAFSSSAVTPSSLVLSGKGASLVATQLSLGVTSPASGNPSFGQTVTVQATLTATGGFTALGAPTGSVTFSVDGQVQGTSSISSTGTASFQLTGLSGGAHAVTATYSGDSNYVSSSTASPTTVTVVPLATATGLVISGTYSNPLSQMPGANVILTATITPVGTPPPTGTVTFLNGTTVLGTATPNVQGVATLNTTTLPTGTLNVVASYGGDINYAVSQSAGVQLIITPQTIAVTPSSTSLTVKSGGTTSTTFTVTSLANFNGIVGMSCSGLPAYSSCAFGTNANASATNPAGGNAIYVQTGVPVPVILEIVTGQAPTYPQPPVSNLLFPSTGSRVPASLAVLLLTPLGLVRRRLWKKYRRTMLMLLLLTGMAGAMAMSGCAKAYWGSTPTGQSTVTLSVSGTSGSVNVTQTATIQLTVQK